MTEPAFDIGEADRRHLWHPYTQHGVAGAPLPIARAKGALLYDNTGRPVFDAISSWWVTLHGHAQPEIVDAIARQAGALDQVIFAGFTHAPAAELAAQLARRAPTGLSRVFFSDDGSTSVEVAVKIALQHWVNRGAPRRLIVALEHAYHGDTFGAMSVSARGLFTDPFTSHLFEVARLPDPVRYDVVAALERLIGEREREIAAVIVEPMLLGAGGMRMWSAGALRGIRALTTAHDIPLIADEVLTGFGRTGPFFACEHAGISPDLMCLSKGITGGFLPLGATLTTDALFDGFRSDDRSKTLFHGHSYTANPIACAAGLASLALFDDSASERRRAIGRSHREAAARLETLVGVSNVRVLGTVLAMELTSPDAGYLSALGPMLFKFAIERGVLLRPLGDTVYVLPPYCSTADQLALAYDTIAEFVETRKR